MNIQDLSIIYGLAKTLAISSNSKTLLSALYVGVGDTASFKNDFFKRIFWIKKNILYLKKRIFLLNKHSSFF